MENPFLDIIRPSIPVEPDTGVRGYDPELGRTRKMAWSLTINSNVRSSDLNFTSVSGDLKGAVDDFFRRVRDGPGEDFLDINARLALTGHDGPVNLIIILARLDFCDVRHLVGLILNGQVFGPHQDRSRRKGGMDLDRNLHASVHGERVEVELDRATGCETVFSRVCILEVVQQRR